MQVNLVNQFSIRKTPYVLYDKATKKFRQISLQERHELFVKLRLKGGSANETMFTTLDKSSNEYKLRDDRPVLLLSSTSYTSDENFGIMVNALDKLQEKIQELSQISKAFVFPRIQVIVTGRGP